MCRIVGVHTQPAYVLREYIRQYGWGWLTSGCCRSVSLSGVAGLGLSKPGTLSRPAHRVNSLLLLSRAAARSGSSMCAQESFVLGLAGCFPCCCWASGQLVANRPADDRLTASCCTRRCSITICCSNRCRSATRSSTESLTGTTGVSCGCCCCCGRELPVAPSIATCACSSCASSASVVGKTPKAAAAASGAAAGAGACCCWKRSCSQSGGW